MKKIKNNVRASYYWIKISYKYGFGLKDIKMLFIILTHPLFTKEVA